MTEFIVEKLNNNYNTNNENKLITLYISYHTIFSLSNLRDASGFWQTLQGR